MKARLLSEEKGFVSAFIQPTRHPCSHAIGSVVATWGESEPPSGETCSSQCMQLLLLSVRFFCCCWHTPTVQNSTPAPQ